MRRLDRTKDIKLTVSIVAYRHLTAWTNICWTRDMMPLSQAFAGLDYRPWGDDALIERTRSTIATNFLERTDSDVLVMLDADMIWSPGSIQAIAVSCDQTRGLVAGAVPKRTFGGGLACRPLDNDYEFQTGTDKLIPASYVGAAFSAIHRDALQAVADHDNPSANSPYGKLPHCIGTCGETFIPFYWPFLRKHPESDTIADALSEDWALSARCMDAGVPIHLDAMPIVQHVGEHIYTISDAFANRADAAAAHSEARMAARKAAQESAAA